MSLHVDLSIKKISTEDGTYLRVSLDQQAVNEIAEALLGGERIIPVVVYHQSGVYQLADGFHRLAGARAAGLKKISAEVRQGTLRDAILHSVKAAAGQGCVRRTNADKRIAVAALLTDAEWARWSDRKIAGVCGVHHDMVGRLRLELSGGDRQMAPTRTVSRNGREYQMDVTMIGAGRSAGKAEARAAENSGDSHAPPRVRTVADGAADESEDSECDDFEYDGDEWYTPAPFIEAARRVFGGRIDLDVASNATANAVVGAKHYFDKNLDALRRRWWGNVFINPPYSTALVNQFTS